MEQMLKMQVKYSTINSLKIAQLSSLLMIAGCGQENGENVRNLHPAAHIGTEFEARGGGEMFSPGGESQDAGDPVVTERGKLWPRPQ